MKPPISGGLLQSVRLHSMGCGVLGDEMFLPGKDEIVRLAC